MSIKSFFYKLFFSRLSIFFWFLSGFSLLVFGFLSVHPFFFRPRTRLQIVGHTYELVVSSTHAERNQGLQGIHLKAGQGMLFAWRFDTTTSFWMLDTPVPLTLVFLSADGRILHVVRMPVQLHAPYVLYRCPVPYRYAVELPFGSVSSTAVGSRVSSL